MTSKKPGSAHKPVSHHHKAAHGGHKSSRKSVTLRPGDRASIHAGVTRANIRWNRTYKAVANLSAKNGYRPDLREAAVARASAIRRSQRPVKPESEKKARGTKAKKAAAAAEN